MEIHPLGNQPMQIIYFDSSPQPPKAELNGNGYRLLNGSTLLKWTVLAPTATDSFLKIEILEEKVILILENEEEGKCSGSKTVTTY